MTPAASHAAQQSKTSRHSPFARIRLLELLDVTVDVKRVLPAPWGGDVDTTLFRSSTTHRSCKHPTVNSIAMHRDIQQFKFSEMYVMMLQEVKHQDNTETLEDCLQCRYLGFSFARSSKLVNPKIVRIITSGNHPGSCTGAGSKELRRTSVRCRPRNDPRNCNLRHAKMYRRHWTGKRFVPTLGRTTPAHYLDSTRTQVSGAHHQAIPGAGEILWSVPGAASGAVLRRDSAALMSTV